MPTKALASLLWRWSAHDTCRTAVESLLNLADVEINGGRPHDIQVHRNEFFQRVLVDTSLGLGESYMDGWWDCERLDELIYRVTCAGLRRHVVSWKDVVALLQAKFMNLQHVGRAFNIGKHHYDMGNELYRAMLDKRMIYSCAYWKDATDLDQAQEAKLDLICRKLRLQPGMRVLDIGCGWGGTAKYAAEKYGVEVYGVTVSAEQAKHARKLCEGLPIIIDLLDYRKIRGKFDRACSIGMFEHVGYKNYRTYMDVVRNCLCEEGLFLLHTIGSNVSDTHGNPWVEKYIFPDAMGPSIAQLGKAIENRFVLEDWQSFGPDYDRTLLRWHENIEHNWPTLETRYDERFRRMWRFYLLGFAGAFRARYLQLWQLVLSPRGWPRRYDALR